MIYDYLVVFILMAVTDVVWAKYTKHLVKKNASIAGFYAVGILLCNGVVTIAYVNDPWLILPAAAGAFVGTYLGIRLG